MNCLIKKYKYTFTFENEIYTTNECYSPYKGTPYCIKDGITYANISYKAEVIGCNDKEFKNSIINFNFIIPLFIISFGSLLIFKFVNKYLIRG